MENIFKVIHCYRFTEDGVHVQRADRGNSNAKVCNVPLKFWNLKFADGVRFHYVANEFLCIFDGLDRVITQSIVRAYGNVASNLFGTKEIVSRVDRSSVFCQTCLYTFWQWQAECLYAGIDESKPHPLFMFYYGSQTTHFHNVVTRTISKQVFIVVEQTISCSTYWAGSITSWALLHRKGEIA